jgi:hypothetical protein
MNETVDNQKKLNKYIEEYITKNYVTLFQKAIARYNFCMEVYYTGFKIRDYCLLMAYCLLYDKKNKELRKWKDDFFELCCGLTTYNFYDFKKKEVKEMKMDVLEEVLFKERKLNMDERINNLYGCDYLYQNKMGIRSMKLEHEMNPQFKEKYFEIINKLIEVISNSNYDNLNKFINKLK